MSSPENAFVWVWLPERQVSIINDEWDDAADVAQLTTQQRDQLWHRQILNPFIHYDD